MEQKIKENFLSGQSIKYISRKYKISIEEIKKIIEGLNPTINSIKKPKHDLSGEIFSKLKVIEMKIPENSLDRAWHAYCQCECGNFTYVLPSFLKRGLKKTCAANNCKFFRQEYTNSRENNVKFTGYKEISGQQWASYKCGAKRRNLEFTITLEYVWNLFIVQNRKCKLSGLFIEFGKLSKSKHTASLDRIDSTVGYIEGNVQWVHTEINFMKSNMSEQRFKELCQFVTNN